MVSARGPRVIAAYDRWWQYLLASQPHDQALLGQACRAVPVPVLLLIGAHANQNTPLFTSRGHIVGVPNSVAYSQYRNASEVRHHAVPLEA